MIKTKRLRQFKFYFKTGDAVTITLEPGDKYAIDHEKRVIVVEGVRPAAKNFKFVYTYNLDDISMRKFTIWDEPDLPVAPPNDDALEEDIPFR